MKETMKKAFIDFDKEEQWLNEQGQKGRMLISITTCYILTARI